jgi:hypothetical protein
LRGYDEKRNTKRNTQQRALTEEEAAIYNEYIVQLRDWLYALPDARFDRERRKLSLADLNHITCLNTYESYQNGGQMRGVIEGRF